MEKCLTTNDVEMWKPSTKLDDAAGITIPAGMRQVSQADFYAAMGAPLNVHPRPEPHHVVWETQDRRVVVGRSWPGYMAVGPRAYALERP